MPEYGFSLNRIRTTGEYGSVKTHILAYFLQCMHIQASFLTDFMSLITFCLLPFIAKFLLSEVIFRFSFFFWNQKPYKHTMCIPR